MKRLVVDTSNILFRVAAAQSKYNSGADDLAGLSMHVALNTLKSHYRKIKPDQVAVAFEGSKNWRKDYTRSPECVSQRLYKGNRVTDDSKIAFYELMTAFEELARKHTSLVCLSRPELEGDDSIAAYVQHFSAVGDEVVILSGDKDFIQLLKLPGVSLLNPDDGKLRGWDKDTGEKIDPIFFMFEKAIRGDTGDNVLTASPRERITKITKAFTNEYDRTNLMNKTWVFSDPETGEKRTLRVGDMFEENQLLMNLERQPAHIRAAMDEMVRHEILHHGTFSLFHFQKFCSKFGLRKIADDAQHFIELFSSTGRNSPLKEETKAVNAEKKRTSTLVF
jgi:DNA polymerase-1